MTRMAVVALAAAATSLGPVAAAAEAGFTIDRFGSSLVLVGDDASDLVRIDRDAAGVIRVDVGQDGTFEHNGPSTIANTDRIVVSAGGGDDTIALSEASGALPSASLGGDDGADTLTAGSGADELNGGAGADTLLGKGGSDILTGGDGADVITGGDADDGTVGGAGDDTFNWNPGDDSDTSNGGPGDDVQVLNGGNGTEVFALQRNGPATGISLSRVSPAAFTIDGRALERVRLFANGGDDSFSATNDLTGFLQSVEADMGAGGAQSFNGSDLPDVVTGGPGVDSIATEEGADVYRWSVGQGSESVDLGSGADEVAVTGSAGADTFTATATGSVLQLTSSADAATVAADHAERLNLDAGDGADAYGATANLTNLVATDVAGGAGNDQLLGSDGPETFRGGDGDDSITASGGDDTLFGDAGTDTLVGDGGRDSFFCGGVGDSIDATAEDIVAADCLPPPQGLPPGFKGFAIGKLSGRLGNLTLRLRNKHTAAITIRVAATEAIPRTAAAAAFRYRAVGKTIQPGATARITLRASAKLRRALKRRLAKRGRLVRRPRITVTNLATGGRTTVRPRVRVRR